MGRRYKKSNTRRGLSENIQSKQSDSVESNSNTKANKSPNLSNATERELTLFAAQQFSGPLPPPAILNEYENIQKGTMQQIIDMAVKTQDHSQYMDRSMLELEGHAIRASTFHSTLGLILAFIIAVIALTGGIYLISIGKTLAGFVPLVGAVGSMAAIFIYQKVMKRKKEPPTSEEDKQLNLPGI